MNNSFSLKKNLPWISSIYLPSRFVPSAGSDGKASAYNAGDPGSISGSGNGNPLQYSCLEIPWTEEPSGVQSMGSQRVGHD